MNIADLSTTLALNKTLEDVGIMVLDKALDTAGDSGDSMIRMMNNSMELAVNPAVGANIDVRL